MLKILILPALLGFFVFMPALIQTQDDQSGDKSDESSAFESGQTSGEPSGETSGELSGQVSGELGWESSEQPGVVSAFQRTAVEVDLTPYTIQTEMDETPFGANIISYIEGKFKP